MFGDAVRRGITVGDGLGGIGMSGDRWSMPRDTVCSLSPATFLSFGCAREGRKGSALLNRAVGSAPWDG
jgi:hypothetical protein